MGLLVFLFFFFKRRKKRFLGSKKRWFSADIVLNVFNLPHRLQPETFEDLEKLEYFWGEFSVLVPGVFGATVLFFYNH